MKEYTVFITKGGVLGKCESVFQLTKLGRKRLQAFLENEEEQEDRESQKKTAGVTEYENTQEDELELRAMYEKLRDIAKENGVSLNWQVIHGTIAFIPMLTKDYTT